MPDPKEIKTNYYRDRSASFSIKSYLISVIKQNVHGSIRKCGDNGPDYMGKFPNGMGRLCV